MFLETLNLFSQPKLARKKVDWIILTFSETSRDQSIFCNVRFL